MDKAATRESGEPEPVEDIDAVKRKRRTSRQADDSQFQDTVVSGWLPQ